MKASIRRLVRARAGQRCEYCRLHEDDLPLFPFHIEHILPKKHGGTDNPKTLGWSCHYCNLAKSSNLSGRDAEPAALPCFSIRAANGGVGILFGMGHVSLASHHAAGRRLPG